MPHEECIDRIYQGKPVTCIQNPGTGRETELDEPVPAAVPRRVVVVGAGVAGLEAARMVALRGHRVVILEREPEARAPARAEYVGILRFLARQVDKLGVDCRLWIAPRSASGWSWWTTCTRSKACPRPSTFSTAAAASS